jgi:hypothetical protein
MKREHFIRLQGFKGTCLYSSSSSPLSLAKQPFFIHSLHRKCCQICPVMVIDHPDFTSLDFARGFFIEQVSSASRPTSTRRSTSLVYMFPSDRMALLHLPVPFPSLSTTRRPKVVEFQPASTWVTISIFLSLFCRQCQ